MADRHIGFAPERPKAPSSEGLVVVGDRPDDIKKALIEALEHVRTNDPSLRTDWDVDCIKDLLGRIEKAQTVLELLSLCMESGIILPGDEKAQEKKPLGFPLPQ